MDRRTSLPGSRISNSSTALSTSHVHTGVQEHSHDVRHNGLGRSVLRQFRPAISDQWLHNQMARRTSMTSPTANTQGDGGNSTLSIHIPTSEHGAIMRMSSLSVRPGVPTSFVCPECLQAFDTHQSLEHHLQRSHSESSAATSSFFSSSSSGHALLNCPHCSEQIKHRTNLHRHIRVKHDERTGRFHCRKCSFVCTVENELEQHKRKHRICPFCRVIMESGTGLAKHMQNCRQRMYPRR